MIDFPKEKGANMLYAFIVGTSDDKSTQFIRILDVPPLPPDKALHMDHHDWASYWYVNEFDRYHVLYHHLPVDSIQCHGSPVHFTHIQRLPVEIIINEAKGL